MAKVICTLPHAGEVISGVKFTPSDHGHKISEDISPDVAAHFMSIPGYKLVDDKAAEKEAAEKGATEKASAKSATK